MGDVIKKIEKNNQSKKNIMLTLQLTIRADMVVSGTSCWLDTEKGNFTYYERADERGNFMSIDDEMREGEPMATDVQDALDKSSDGSWRVDRESLYEKYKYRQVVVLEGGNRVKLDNIGWGEYVFPVLKNVQSKNDSNESDDQNNN